MQVYKSRMQQFDETYLRITKEIASFSRAKRKKVGAILVKDNNIISYGFNGTPEGFTNECEDAEGDTLDTVLHAETNAITKAARNTVSTEGATLYLTFSPCLNCSKLILQCRITRVVYEEQHSNTDGLELLKKGGVCIQQIKEEE